jgi:hypothetical protein
MAYDVAPAEFDELKAKVLLFAEAEGLSGMQVLGFSDPALRSENDFHISISDNRGMFISLGTRLGELPIVASAYECRSDADPQAVALRLHQLLSADWQTAMPLQEQSP